MLRSRVLRQIKQWHESPVVVDRKSKFQARNARITDASEISGVLNQFLAENKNAAKASHPHILAWRTAEETITFEKVGKSQKEIRSLHNLQQGFKDNGEKGAGQKMLDFMVSHGIYNRMFWVTRWYGGSPLGSSRFRHIVGCCRESWKRVENE